MRARAERHLVAHAADIDDRRVERHRIEPTGELSDHGAASVTNAASSRRQERECAWVMAMASASAASALSKDARGKRHLTMALIWPLSPWPAPTTVFFTAFGAYSAITNPDSAGTNSAMPRAWPSFKVAARVAIDESLLDRRLYRCKPRHHLGKPLEDLAQPGAQAFSVIGDHRAAGHEGQPDPVAVDDPPAGAPQPRVDADDANPAAWLCAGSSQRALPRNAQFRTNHLCDSATEPGAKVAARLHKERGTRLCVYDLGLALDLRRFDGEAPVTPARKRRRQPSGFGLRLDFEGAPSGWCQQDARPDRGRRGRHRWVEGPDCRGRTTTLASISVGLRITMLPKSATRAGSWFTTRFTGWSLRDGGWCGC